MRANVDRCLAAIARALPDDRVITDADVCAAHARDESEAVGAIPDAVIRARGAQEIAVVMREASAHGVPVTPRGAGTGRTGGAVPVRGGIVLACDRMRDIVEIDRVDSLAVVEPGLVTGALYEAVEREGLFWGPDPNSWEQCTIGGNVAENAAGPRAFKHGSTRDWVLGLEVVTAEGTILPLGRRTKKGVTGYDLTSLIVGSEGTLAFVTRAVLRLAPLAERVITVLAFLDREDAIAPAVSAALSARVVPRCIELLDAETLAILRAGASAIAIPEAAKALLVIELEGTSETVESELARLGDALVSVSPFDPLVATETSERERFWRVRRDMSRALRRSAGFKLSEDVVVPRRRLAELITTCREIAARRGIRMPAYGHAGDGNLHVNLLWDHAEQEPAVQQAIRELFETTIALGGTLSGEHGIGVLKAPYLPLEQPEPLIALQRRVKDVFDPRGVLNPGKIFPGDGHRHGC
ncbi:FAD-binding oxidoreductase [Sandaracinus amylolyticus]|uniref:Glycolate dehydrogenase n=1 Tax=Sandaracinus amylolyticus TaxID=927083 RepID=A0A0F6YKS1_9BACT|nr:FAD-linked oxidase C-terminal domain-containing protein [Sandaracinus amylolyticus]AKF09501.1 Glycolate dehydrogenase [Sandaracinus amylolyticus]